MDDASQWLTVTQRGGLLGSCMRSLGDVVRPLPGVSSTFESLPA